MESLANVMRQIRDREVVSLDLLMGCTDEEIEELKVDQGVSRLPASYEWFLRTMGRGAGPILRGTHAFFPQLLGLKAAGIELLAENNAEDVIMPDAFVIGMHQGYQLFWFPSVSLTEPPVLMYQEGDRANSRKWEDFETYLTDVISGLGQW
jgi:hypothetical protein